MAKKNDVCRCIARVYRWGALRPHRCSNPVWKDGYCKTHHMKIPAVTKNGKWKISAMKIAEALACEPDDLWTQAQRTAALELEHKLGLPYGRQKYRYK